MAGKITCECGKRYSWKPELAGKRAKCKCGGIVKFPMEDPEALELAEAKDFDALIRSMPPHETSESGADIYRHEARTKPFELAIGDSDSIDAISKHIEKYIGPADGVFHEIVSDLVHIDIHMVAPTEARPWHTLVTSGMSDRPMTVGDDPAMREFAHAELLICLPPDWPLDEQSFEDDANYWPIRWLKTIARMPHEYETWVGSGHTIPNGDPPEPFGSNTKMCCMLLLQSSLVEEGFHQLKVGGKTINFYALFPLYKEEMEAKLKKGSDYLMEKFDKEQITELLDVGRKNSCRKFMGLF